jgi:hypothetical protein
MSSSVASKQFFTLNERRGKADYVKRIEAMDTAWRQWRNAVIDAAAARVKAVGIEHDDELDLLAARL